MTIFYHVVHHALAAIRVLQFNSIQFSFIFRHTYTLAMHNTEVQSKILDSKKNKNRNSSHARKCT